MAEIHCRHFNGYKPCARGVCDALCPSRSLVGQRVLIVHLEAQGAVLRSTSLLNAIRRKYPACHLTWVTKYPWLLRGLGDVDRILSLEAEDLLRLAALQFDVALVVDKSLVACGLVARTASVGLRVFGFTSDPVAGAIVPANPEAEELWRLGLDDHLKFFINQKSEQQLVHESLALGPYLRDEYQVLLNSDERALARVRRQMWGAGGGTSIVGINTGCSPALPHKKLSVAGHRQLIEEIKRSPILRESPIVLLGGPEDSERNAEIAKGFRDVITSPTQRGGRDGLVSVAACDLVFSGDSLGMHMAIALKKWVVAWFGPSCPQEIDLYGRGRKILTAAPCSPCWKRECHKPVMCYDQVKFAAAVSALEEGAERGPVELTA